ncbi:NDxxF motif lipoprotein [Macrococcoides bohemicum]|uniref:NDxxF motif lipoprotein n=1 Tax=Macrococcoides bohemicum TaxID=1903056 RepID=UPI00165D954C|nr:NDxxF motif lipoprotein [Macrococcus bohemicus]MBC9873248.1 NDxxF motif lipoprotein [Macrococcus bohemicus]
MFINNSINKNITKSQLRQDIKTYLDLQKKLLSQEKVIEQLSNGKVEEKYKNKIHRIIILSNKNDKNFHYYIENNNIPNEYKEDVFRISNYISGSNKITISANDEIMKYINNLSNGNFKELKFVIPKKLMEKNKKKLKNFYLKKKIKTNAFIK